MRRAEKWKSVTAHWFAMRLPSRVVEWAVVRALTRARLAFPSTPLAEITVYDTLRAWGGLVSLDPAIQASTPVFSISLGTGAYRVRSGYRQEIPLMRIVSSGSRGAVLMDLRFFTKESLSSFSEQLASLQLDSRWARVPRAAGKPPAAGSLPTDAGG